MHNVYILRSEKDGNLYAGYTTNVPKRFEAHNDGSVISTRNRRPLEVIFVESFVSKYDALRRERYFKTNEGRKMLKLILRDTLLEKEKEESALLEEEIELDMLRWKSAQELAKELVLARGWSEQDEDFLIQVEEEAKRQWDEDYEREYSKRYPEIHSA